MEILKESLADNAASQDAQRGREAIHWPVIRLMLVFAEHSESLDTWEDLQMMWDVTLPTQKDLLTNSRDLWPKLFYLLYFFSIFILKS